eukprot:10687935-Alexandrium_andersonii.AAC.1
MRPPPQDFGLQLHTESVGAVGENASQHEIINIEQESDILLQTAEDGVATESFLPMKENTGNPHPKITHESLRHQDDTLST